MNIVVGASGYIGQLLYERLATVGEVVGTSSSADRAPLHQLDLARAETYEFLDIDEASTVFLAGAASAPDFCAKHPEAAWRINVTGTIEFASACIAKGARVILFSSDTVYGSRETDFDESADCEPAGSYAEMKRAVEVNFTDEPLFKAVRLSYVFSRDDKFTRYLAGCASRGEVAGVFHPFYRSVVHREDVVDGVIALSRNWADFPDRFLNFGGPETLSRVEFCEILRADCLPGLEFEISEPDPDFFKNRPRQIRMRSPRLDVLLGRPARTLRQAAKFEFESGN